MARNTNKTRKEKEIETLRKRHAAMLDALRNARAAYDAGTIKNISFSGGNIKMGAIPSVSLLPIVTCPGACLETCAGKCYAAKIAALRPAVRDAYARNTIWAIMDLPAYMAAVATYTRALRFFRWHVSGDIPAGKLGRDYFAGMVDIARNNPKCEYLAFTKNAAIVNSYIAQNGGTADAIPSNLKIIFSNWGAFKLSNPYALPVSEVIFSGEGPADAWKVCGGNCYECACRGVGCWEIKSGETIAFYEH